jgi:Cu/Ag efflux pump CusA
MQVTTPINIRYPQGYRDGPETLRQLPILTPMKQQILDAMIVKSQVTQTVARVSKSTVKKI